jgi:hypothetical protein
MRESLHSTTSVCSEYRMHSNASKQFLSHSSLSLSGLETYVQFLISAYREESENYGMRNKVKPSRYTLWRRLREEDEKKKPLLVLDLGTRWR